MHGLREGVVFGNGGRICGLQGTPDLERVGAQIGGRGPGDSTGPNGESKRLIGRIRNMGEPPLTAENVARYHDPSP